MEKGLNSNVFYNGKNYHVQTEDWGFENPYFVSQVFREGVIKKNIKTSYNDIFEDEASLNKNEIQLALRLQHRQILDLLLSGRLL